MQDLNIIPNFNFPNVQSYQTDLPKVLKHCMFIVVCSSEETDLNVVVSDNNVH